MIVILARASARYSGRIVAELALGDICILIKDIESGGDGSVILHDMQNGVMQQNWMPAGSVMSTIEGGYRFDYTKRQPPERLEIYIETVYSEQRQVGTLPTKMVKLGAEQQFSDRLAHCVHLIGDVELIAREWRTPAGPVDLLCSDKDGNPVAVEVKRRTIDPNAIWQMRRYLHALNDHPDWHGKQPRGVMVAPSLMKTAGQMLEDHDDITFVRVTYEQLLTLTGGETVETTPTLDLPSTSQLLGLNLPDQPAD